MMCVLHNKRVKFLYGSWCYIYTSLRCCNIMVNVQWIFNVLGKRTLRMIGISLVAMVMMLFGVITNISADPMLEIQPIQPLLSVQTMWQNFQRDNSKFSYMTIQNNLKRKYLQILQIKMFIVYSTKL